ncbi:hypothetical protein BGZ80_002448 [Entomortierella chlamydospora]|uniref:Uncharacterized protein n=1 Tax=Entomortierella chlamydospora TaxID=101097 RepID=A0A9P6SX46_9FUNG|nr:hypothetical protein BGZ79_000642 [Entomortierella chlamydospora]KAG0009388.1 hypothetical protein BGZ80_002448 [Entomortierella chlamydospora]
MALVSGNTSDLGNIKNRISFREDLNDTHHCDDDGFSSDNFSDDDDATSPPNDADTAEIASIERRALKYRQSLTMLNQLARMSIADGDEDATSDEASAPEGIRQPSKEHLLAAKKSIDDLTAWVNASALGDDDDDD